MSGAAIVRSSVSHKKWDGRRRASISMRRRSSPQGLTVHLGDLRGGTFGDRAFDLVMSNNVLRHVSDSITFLRQCRYLLRPGGAVPAATANAESWGYAVFARNWIGLDAARHLQIFSSGGSRKSGAIRRLSAGDDLFACPLHPLVLRDRAATEKRAASRPNPATHLAARQIGRSVGASH